MESAKAVVACLALIVTSITASGLIPASGNWHVFWTVLSIVVGVLATYFVPNKPAKEVNRSE